MSASHNYPPKNRDAILDLVRNRIHYELNIDFKAYYHFSYCLYDFLPPRTPHRILVYSSIVREIGARENILFLGLSS